MKKFKSIIAAVLITLSFILVIGIISSAALMTIEKPEDYISLVSGGAQLIYLIGAAVILRIRKIDLAERCGVDFAPFKALLMPCAAALCFSVFSNILQEALPIPLFLLGETDDMIGNNIIAFIAAVFIIAPVTEEFVFRGLIMTKLRGAVGALPAVFISALLFGLIHLMTGSVITGIHALLGGLIFGLAYEKTGSLFVAVAAHIMGNLGGLIPYLTRRFETVPQIVIAVFAGVVAVVICGVMIRRHPSKVKEGA